MKWWYTRWNAMYEFTSSKDEMVDGLHMLKFFFCFQCILLIPMWLDAIDSYNKRLCSLLAHLFPVQASCLVICEITEESSL